MAYSDDAAMRQDGDLRARLIAAAVREGVTPPNGETVDQWVDAHMNSFAASPGWSDKWGSAVERRRYTVGNDPAVISDGDILAAVQALNPPA